MTCSLSDHFLKEMNGVVVGVDAVVVASAFDVVVVVAVVLLTAAVDVAKTLYLIYLFLSQD